MDIEKLYTLDAHDSGSELQLKDQFGKNIDSYVTVVGLDSKVWRQIDAERNQKLVAKMIAKDDSPVDDTTAETLARATVSWRGFTSDGKELEFSKASAAELYKKAPYIADQVDRFIGRRANFIRG